MNWQQLSQSTPADILVWAAEEPWCRAMAACRQDTQWHAERDVWTHTQMVCHQLERLEGWRENVPPQEGSVESKPHHHPLPPARANRRASVVPISDYEKTVLIFTALFHDSGKPQTSRLDPESGHIRSPKHALVGEHLARSVLRDLGCDLTTREAIARLVRFHGRPVFLLERTRPEHEVVSLSWRVSNRLLYLFALADTRGRSTASDGRPEENLELFKMTAEENNCFETPYPFVNNHARFLFYRQSQPNLQFAPHEEYRCTVTMLSGLPGSGKNSWLLCHRPESPVVGLDELREELAIGPTDNQGAVAQLAREKCRELLRAQTDFAFNATNLLRQTRQRWIDLFADYGARIEIVYLEPPLEQILSQNRRRERSVPEKVIRQLAAKLEPPTWAECHQLIVRPE